MDMAEPGSHLKELLAQAEFDRDENREKSRTHSLMADLHERFAHKLRRALEEEAKKSPPETRDEHG